MSETGSKRAARRRRPGSLVLAIAALAAWGLPQALHAQPVENAWNPVPRPDDVVFPLPCGQKIALRKVVTQAGRNAVEARLDDRRIRLGRSNENTAYYDYYRQEFIAGHFADAESRFYLIGKYEVTRAQYRSLMAAECDNTSDEGLPAAGMSWYDAVEFTRRLTAHVRGNAAAELAAAVGQGAAYFRLPTEAEWEFAARGGLAASTEEYQADRLPLRGNPADSIWYNDPLSAQGRALPIGLLQSNPLHLYDAHGNVAEMLLEPFRLNRAGRMHGLAGGFIAKGGSYLSQLQQTGNASRREHGYFRSDGSGEYTADDLGFRVAVASPALLGSVDGIRNEWRRAGEPRRLEGADPVEQLAELQNDLTDLQLARALDEIRQSILTQSSGRNEAQYRMLDGLLLGSGRMVLEIRKRHRDISGRRASIASNVPAELLRQLERHNATDESAIADFNYFNHDLLTRIVEEFTEEEIVAGKERVVGELGSRNLQDHEIARSVAIGGDIARQMASAAASFDRLEILRLATQDLP